MVVRVGNRGGGTTVTWQRQFEGGGVGEGGPQLLGSDNQCELNDLPKARIMENN